MGAGEGRGHDLGGVSRAAGMVGGRDRVRVRARLLFYRAVETEAETEA